MTEANHLPCFIGCDSTSAFHGKGKKSAWATWSSFPDVTQAFISLSSSPATITDDDIALLERYVALLYDRTSSAVDVNVARKDLFTRKGRSTDAIPPTKAALLQHVKRVVYQAGYCWGQALIAEQNLPCPSEWGWIKDQNYWQPMWTTLPEAAKSCQELIRCGCTRRCQGNCKCAKASLKCTNNCECRAGCTRN